MRALALILVAAQLALAAVVLLFAPHAGPSKSPPPDGPVHREGRRPALLDDQAGY
jgi:hypothetical protein